MRKLIELLRKPKYVLNQAQRVFFEENGYLILEGFYPTSEVDDFLRAIDDLWVQSRKGSTNIVVDIFTETPNQRRVKLSDAPYDARYAPHKLNDLFLEYQNVRDFVLNQAMGAILTELLGKVPLICNTLNFTYGSQQDFHTDSLYMTPLKKLNLIATWAALEDCHPDAGPLVYYPGSHKIKPYLFSNGKMGAIHEEMSAYRKYMDEQVASLNLKVMRFIPKKGDVLIWHSQLFHGGSKIEDKSKTRKSIVTHFYAEEDYT
ncbi:MAG: hypothetical protein RL189_2038, partial [Pseudomonadota bacterium]